MKVDLTLLVPDWLLQYERWRQFLEALEESINATLAEVDKVGKVYDVGDIERYFSEDVVVEYLGRLSRQFGIGELAGIGKDELKVLVRDARGLVEKKSSKVFFEKLFELFGLSFMLRDLSKEIIRLSEQGVLSGKFVLQDGVYYRDGSVEVTVPMASQSLVQQMMRWISAGVYVWMFVVSGIVWLEEKAVVSNVGKRDDFAVRDFCLLSSMGGLRIEGGVSGAEKVVSDAEIESRYFSLNLMKGIGGRFVISV